MFSLVEFQTESNRFKPDRNQWLVILISAPISRHNQLLVTWTN